MYTDLELNCRCCSFIIFIYFLFGVRIIFTFLILLYTQDEKDIKNYESVAGIVNKLLKYYLKEKNALKSNHKLLI